MAAASRRLADSFRQGFAGCQFQRHREVRVRVLILGGDGQIARATYAAAPVQHQVTTMNRAQLDIRDATDVSRLFQEMHPDWIVNGAAYTAVDLAEDHPAEAIAINDTAVGVLVKAAEQAGSRLLHLSTDYVFDGKGNQAYRPGDRPNPLGVYGVSKLAGEQQVLHAAADGIVLRTSWVYASEGSNFVLTMLRLMREKSEIRVVSDQLGAPTWARSVAAAIWGLIDASVPGGVYHWNDLGVASWYDFAVAIQEEALARQLLSRGIPILPIQTAEYASRAKRPGFSVLNSETTRSLTNITARHWRHNLRMMLDELRAA
jgi:dTDP-4-dehydrorhamnose reductase